MATVTAVQPKGDKAGILVMDDGSRVWTPEKAKGDELVGKPIPADWTIKQGDYGPQAFPPRAKGGGAPAAWRNTKEGAEFEAENWRRKHEIEEERRDRRTALMQAVEYAGKYPSEAQFGPMPWATFADEFYTWLRKTSGGGSPSKRGSDKAPPTPSTAPPPGPPVSATNNEGSGPSGPSEGAARAETSEPAGAGVGEAPASAGADTCATCGLDQLTGFKDDGNPLPRGFLRCTNALCEDVGVPKKVKAA